MRTSYESAEARDHGRRGLKRKRGGSSTIIFLCCTLAVPTMHQLMGLYDGMPTREQLAPALLTGMILGVAHLLVRPVLRLLSAPIGCLTLGLFGLVIDVGLIYGCGALVPKFEVPGPLFALLTAVLINSICAVAGGRR